jgi:deazaflavin-dependent oxidoreductase (nitroreductase family)
MSKPDQRLSLSARLNLSGSQFANKRGIYLGRRSTKIHVALYRKTKGKVGGRLPGFPDVPIVLVDHVGAKTGKRRTSPLMYHEDNRVVAVAASKAGEPTHPAWFHNLMANPDTTIQTGADVREVRARVATESEHAEWWPRLVKKYPGYEFFQQRAKDREIPVVLFEPARAVQPPEVGSGTTDHQRAPA